MYLIFLSNFPLLALKIIANTSSSLEFRQRQHRHDAGGSHWCVYSGMVQNTIYVSKGVVKRSLIGSSTRVIGPLADLSGFHSSLAEGNENTG